MLTREDVIWCYNTFLQRPPESDEVIDGWVERCSDFRQLARAFEESPEHQKLQIARVRAESPPVSQAPTQGWIPYVPRPPFSVRPTAEFMQYSTCVAEDFMHPRFMEICDGFKHWFQFHRKLWEWVFIVHHLLKSGVVRKGARGLVFGVGAERLPAYFASLGASIVATETSASSAPMIFFMLWFPR